MSANSRDRFHVIFLSNSLFIRFCEYYDKIFDYEINDKKASSSEINPKIKASLLKILDFGLSGKKFSKEELSVRFTPSLLNTFNHLWADESFHKSIPNYFEAFEKQNKDKIPFVILNGKFSCVQEIDVAEWTGDFVNYYYDAEKNTYIYYDAEKNIFIQMLIEFFDPLFTDSNAMTMHGKEASILTMWPNGFYMNEGEIPSCKAVAVVI